MKKLIFISLLAAVLLAGCATKTSNIDTINDPGKAVMGLDYRDFNRAAADMIESLIKSGSLKKDDGSRYVVTTARIVNDTMQRIDTDQLMAKVEEELMKSGQVVMTSAVGGAGAKDEMVYQVREMRDSEVADEFNKDTLIGKGNLVAPELSISGKIIQKDVKYDKKTTQVEYYFQLRVSDLTTGLRFWQGEVVMGKRGDRKSVSW